MASRFTINGNSTLPKVPMSTDNELHPNLKPPLDSITSGKLVVISGAAGSGKSSILLNLFLLPKCKKTKKKCNFKACFDAVFVVSPSMGSFRTNIFESIPDEYKFDNLLDFLDSYRDMVEPDSEVCIILDDVGSQIRTKEVLHKFSHLVQNRRHQHLTIFCLVQTVGMLNPAMRDSMNMLITFKPKTFREKELIFELTGLPKKHMEDFYSSCYVNKHDSVLVDMTLRRSNDYQFYRNLFDPITIAGDKKEELIK